VTYTAAIKALTYLPALLLGIWLGARFFKHMDPAKFRNWVLLILALLGAISIAKGARLF
jgi:uncharacterized protein